ncbi:hypothetical protein ACFX2C_029201 [Malus domestica]
MKKSAEEQAETLKSKERQLEEQATELALKQKELDSIKKATEDRTETLNSKERELDHQAKELALKQKELDSIKKAIEDRNQTLNSKERELDHQGKELEVKQKELNSIKELEPVIDSNAAVHSSASNESSVDWDGRGQKRSTATFDSGFQPPQQRERKYPRTSEPAVPPKSVPTYNTGYRPPSESAVTHYQVRNYTPVGYPQPGPPPPWHYENGHLGQFGMTNFGPNTHYRPPYFPGPPPTPPPPPPPPVSHPRYVGPF